MDAPSDEFSLYLSNQQIIKLSLPNSRQCSYTTAVETQKFAASVLSRTVGVDWTYYAANKLMGKLDANSLYRGYHRKKLTQILDTVIDANDSCGHDDDNPQYNEVQRLAASICNIPDSLIEDANDSDDGAECEMKSIERDTSGDNMLNLERTGSERNDPSISNVLGLDSKSRVLTLNADIETRGMKRSDFVKDKSIVKRRLNASLLLIINHVGMVQRFVYVPGMYSASVRQ